MFPILPGHQTSLFPDGLPDGLLWDSGWDPRDGGARPQVFDVVEFELDFELGVELGFEVELEFEFEFSFEC